MANPRHPTSGQIGHFTAEPQTTSLERPADMKPGTVFYGADNTQWACGTASGAVSTGTCTYNATTFLITDAAGNHTADTALADGQIGYVRLTAGATS